MNIFSYIFYSYYLARLHKLQSFNFNRAEIKAVCLCLFVCLYRIVSCCVVLRCLFFHCIVLVWCCVVLCFDKLC